MVREEALVRWLLVLLTVPAILVAYGVYELTELLNPPKTRSAYRMEPGAGEVFASCWVTYDEPEPGEPKIRRLACR